MRRGIPTLQRIILLAALCGLSILPAKLLAAPQQTAWFSSGTPVFATQNPNVSESQYPTTFAQHGNVDCTNLSFTKRDGAFIPPLFYSESQLSGCFLDTTVGEVLDNGREGFKDYAQYRNRSDSIAVFVDFRKHPLFCFNDLLLYRS